MRSRSDEDEKRLSERKEEETTSSRLVLRRLMKVGAGGRGRENGLYGMLGGKGIVLGEGGRVGSGFER